MGTENGQLWKISDAQKTSNQTKELISGNDFVGSISDVEFGENENEIFNMYNSYYNSF